MDVYVKLSQKLILDESKNLMFFFIILKVMHLMFIKNQMDLLSQLNTQYFSLTCIFKHPRHPLTLTF